MTSRVNQTKAISSVLCSVGGLVLGTAALRTLSLHDPEKEQMLRGDGQNSSRAASTTEIEKTTETFYGWALEEAQSSRSLLELPGSESPPSNISRRTNLFLSGNDDLGFSLKLYWREGYYWQESYDETWWCLSCGYNADCKKNEVMRLASRRLSQ